MAQLKTDSTAVSKAHFDVKDLNSLSKILSSSLLNINPVN